MQPTSWIRRVLHVVVTMLLLSFPQFATAAEAKPWRPPAYPLVACDPYFSIWSRGETIVDADTTHWTGKPQRLMSVVRVDGQLYRLLGDMPEEMPALAQESFSVLPTRSIFTMTGAGISIELTFTTPAIPYDIDLLSRPITYVDFRIQSADGKPHDVQVLFAASGELAVDTPDQQVTGEAVNLPGATVERVGSVDQHVLGRKGDDLRIDWGYFYLAASKAMASSSGIGKPHELGSEFAAGNPLATSANASPAEGGDIVLAVALNPVRATASAKSQWLLLAYDDLFSIEYMHRPLRPYWRRNGLDGEGLVREALRDHDKLVAQCKTFDAELVADLQAAGGPEYADIASLAYRQCFAAGKFAADANGQPIQFSKENHSNGCIATSDVFYPMSPQFLLLGPSLAKSFVVPFMEYAESDRWTFPFAPHDLGTYPKANGQVYGGGERSEENQMPVEESGNMLLLMGAIAKMEGNADFAGQYWPMLVEWAEYLKKVGFDPDRQLCTDDFAGHLAHNVNLSAKAICGLGAFAQLCELRGEQQLADEYRTAAKQFAQRWIDEAKDGDHYRLAFDKPGTWSQKYNLVWDRILGLDLFPESVARTEMDYYKKVQNRFGLPLDNRREYTKLDWVLWTATLTQNRDDFVALVRPVHLFLDETPDRSPMTDWYETKSGKKVGFTARPVVGGVFLQMLYNDGVWQKWAGRDRTRAAGYADMPRPPKVTIQVPTAESKAVEWRYTTSRPAENWEETDFDDSAWQAGRAGFGTPGTPNAIVGTTWDSPDIWLRRQFDLDGIGTEDLQLRLHHDEDVEVFINGVLARRMGSYSTDYDQLPLRDEARATLKPTGNVIAVHCHQTGGGQYIDVGMATVEPAE